MTFSYMYMIYFDQILSPSTLSCAPSLSHWSLSSFQISLLSTFMSLKKRKSLWILHMKENMCY
jgi:hypothetical protein